MRCVEGNAFNPVLQFRLETAHAKKLSIMHFFHQPSRRFLWKLTWIGAQSALLCGN